MRGFLPYVATGLILALSACGRPTTPAGAGKPPVPSQPEAPTFWSVQTRDDQGTVTKTVLICADKAVHRSFSNPLPSPNGKPCVLLAPPVEEAGRFAARCKAGVGHFDIQAVRTGDADRDFEIKLLVRSDIQGSENLSQTLHYSRLGDCPTGWGVGDSATPGDRKIVNSLSGASRDVSSPVAAPAS